MSVGSNRAAEPLYEEDRRHLQSRHVASKYLQLRIKTRFKFNETRQIGILRLDMLSKHVLFCRNQHDEKLCSRMSTAFGHGVQRA